MKHAPDSPAPADAEDRKSFAPVICYPIDTLPAYDPSVFANPRESLKLIDEATVQPRDAETFRVAQGVKIVGLCIGSFAIARAGLLAGRRPAIHAHHGLEFLSMFPNSVPVENELCVSDGNVVTCPGGTAAIDPAVEILIEHCGRSRGMKSLTALVVDEHRSAHEVGRLPYQDLEDCGNWRVEQAIKIMRRQLRKPHSTKRLARMIGSTVRQLNRVFLEHARATPQEVWRDMRLQHGRWRLVNSRRTVTQIAYECGFADSSHFSRWFKLKFGETPRSYREHRVARQR